MRSAILTLLLLFSGLDFASAQSTLPRAEADSLWAVWSDPAQPDTARLKAIDVFTYNGYLFSQPDSAFYYAQLQYDFAESKGLKKQMASALNSQGISWLNRGEYSNALNYFLPGVKIDEELGNKENLAWSLIQLGQVYAQLGAYSNALEHFQRALKLWEELGTIRASRVC